MKVVLVYLSLLPGLVGCGSQRVVTRLKLPPRVQALGTATTLHLDAFGGGRGADATRTLSTLIQVGRFHKLTQGPGAARIEGTVLPDAYTAEHTQSEDRRCVARTKKGGCTRYAKVPVYHLAEGCTVRVDGRVVQPDGQVLMARTFEGRRAEKQVSEKARPPEQAGALCAQAADDAIRALAAFITPMDTQIALDFRTVSDPGERTAKGIQEAERGRFEAARAIFATLANDPALEPEQRGWSHYNHAVTLWALAAFGPCVEALDRAAETISGEEVRGMRAACADYLQ